MASAPADDTLLHFEESIHVNVPPLDLVRLRAEWTRHWNLSGHEGEANGPPTPSDMRDRWSYLSSLSGHPVPQALPLQELLITVGRALTERLTRKSMPPAGPPAPPITKPSPLQVHVEESETEASGVSSAAENEPTASPSPDVPEITTIVGGRRARE